MVAFIDDSCATGRVSNDTKLEAGGLRSGRTSAIKPPSVRRRPVSDRGSHVSLGAKAACAAQSKDIRSARGTS